MVAHGQTTENFYCNNVTTNCSGHADSVTGGYVNQFGQPVCNCTCSNQYTGERCDFCAAKYNQTDCGSCAFGFINYPNCTSDACTQADCSNRASGISGYRSTGCNCSCINQFSGDKCQTCAPNYNQGSCGSCASGFDEYPGCYKKCTIEGNCSINAISVTGNENKGCTCKCAVSYTGPRCTFCPPGYDPQTCAACLPGYGPQYPDCQPLCTIANNCSGVQRALQVSGIATESCKCTCRNQWAQPDCAICPPQFAGSFCSRCQTGYDFYPDCVICTATANCSGNSKTDPVWQPSTKTCDCGACRNSWTGPTCSDCPARYNAAIDCAACAPGYSGRPQYPACDKDCTVENACSGHASQATGTFNEGCVCTCLNQWDGPACEICPEQYSSASNCAACASGYDPATYPVCTPLPTPAPPPVTAVPLSPTTPSPDGSNATNAPGETPSPDGSTPDPAAPPSNETTAPGSNDTTAAPIAPTNESSKTNPPPPSFTRQLTRSASLTESLSYPPTQSNSTSLTETRCAKSVADCLVSNNSLELEPANCSCFCFNQWSNPFCEFCHPRYNESNNCSSCSPGYVFYPSCNWAVYVSGNWSVVPLPPEILRKARQADLLGAIAEDLNHVLGNLSCGDSVNATAFVMTWNDTASSFEYDIDVLDSSRELAMNASECIVDALVHTDWAAVELNATNALLRALFPDESGNATTMTLGNLTVELSETNPCGEVQCVNGPPVRNPAAAADEGGLSAGAIAGISILLILLLIIASLIIAKLLMGRGKEPQKGTLKERPLMSDEMAWCSQEMEDQSLTGGRSDPYRGNAQNSEGMDMLLHQGSSVRTKRRPKIESEDI